MKASEKWHLPWYLKGKWKWRKQKSEGRVFQAGVAFAKALWFLGAWQVWGTWEVCQVRGSHGLEHSTGIPQVIAHFIVLHFTALYRYYVLYRLKVCDSPALSKSVVKQQVLFSQQQLLTSCLCHVLVILLIFQTFSLLLYFLWWSVISDLWCYYSKKITTHWRLRWWLAFFSNKVFLN